LKCCIKKKQRGQRDFRDEGTVDEGDAEVDADEAEISESGESAENEDNESGDLDDDGQLEILDGTDSGDSNSMQLLSCQISIRML
jgi:hypothetical protein